ncbi:MAG: alkaline phosphatase family protein, partial [Acidobacteriota bacterium]
MTRLTLVLLIDAMARHYVRHTAFVRRLMAEGRSAALREDLGFLPRGSYFGGQTPSEIRFTNLYSCDRAASPFSVAARMPRGFEYPVEEALGARRWVEHQAKTRLPAYAASYLWTHHVPMALLPWFDVVEKYAPYDRRVGYRSVFHELDDRGLRFHYSAWPDTNRLANHSDRAIVDHVLASIEQGGAGCRLAVVHLQELDGIGHAFGPQSAEILAALATTDALVDTLVTTLRRRF